MHALVADFMTLRTGHLLKVWAALSLGWAVGWSWYYHLDSCRALHDGENTTIGWHCDGPVGATGQHEIVPLIVMVAVIAGLPLAVLVAGLALRLLTPLGAPTIRSPEAAARDAAARGKSASNP